MIDCVSDVVYIGQSCWLTIAKRRLVANDELLRRGIRLGSLLLAEYSGAKMWETGLCRLFMVLQRVWMLTIVARIAANGIVWYGIYAFMIHTKQKELLGYPILFFSGKHLSDQRVLW